MAMGAGENKTGLRNKYVSVVVKGQLCGWTGPNPDKDPTAKRMALRIAASHRMTGDTAYAVTVEEILPEDSQDSE